MSSAEAQFRAVLSAHAPLTAVIGTRIALNAIPEGGGFPCVVYAVRTEPAQTLLGAGDELQATISVQCWAANPLAARDLADLVRDAIDTADAARCAYVLSEATVFDEEMGLDGVQLEVDWTP
jgi:hypothetical protein